MWIKKTDPKLDDGQPEWQLASPAMALATPGTVIGVGPAGKPYVVDHVDLKLAARPLTAKPTRVHGTDGTYARVFGIGAPRAGAGSRHVDRFTVDLPELVETAMVDDDDLEARTEALVEKIQTIYRADNRYFVVRGVLSTQSVVAHLTPDQATRLGVVAPSGPARSAIAIAIPCTFPHKTQLAVLLDEIRPVRGSLGNDTPKLGMAPVKDPPPLDEDATVPWVTSILSPAGAAATRVVPIAETVALRTSIGLAAGAGELASLGISPDLLTNAILQFKVAATNARVRPNASAGELAASIASPELHFVADSPPVFDFQLEATAAGPVAVRVTLVLNGRPALRQDLALTAAERAPAGVVAASGPITTPVDGYNLVTLPPPRVALELGSYDDEYAIELTVDGRRAERPAHPRMNPADLAHHAIEWRKRLVALSEQYGRAADDELATAVPDAVRAFACIGVEIHQALFGHAGARGIEDLRRMADAIAQIGGEAAPRPLVVISADRLPLPWGIVYDRPLGDGAPVDPRGFWGQRFLIERIAPAVLGKVPSRALHAPGEVGAQLVPCLNPHLDGQQRVAAAAKQRAFFAALTPAGLTCQPVLDSREAFGKWLAGDRGACRLIYFFCHASSAKTIDDRFFLSRDASDVATWLDLDGDDGSRIDIDWLSRTRTAPLAGQPLVFLNACSTAEGDREFQSPFLTQFIRDYDARALIGSDWKIPTVFADAFSRRFLRRFLDGQNLGQAFVATTDEFMAAANPFPLIYAIYGRTDIVCEERA